MPRCETVLALGLAALIGPGCVGPDTGTPTVVQQALLAQKQGPGGCQSLDWVNPVELPYFEGVRFFQAQCLLEHGDTVRMTAALDDATAFVLDNQSSYRFLLARHPATGVDSASALDYVEWGLRFTGRLRSWTQVIGSLAEVPDSVRQAIVSAGWELPATGVYWVKPRFLGLWVLTYDPGAVILYQIYLSGTHGEMIAIDDTIWTRDGGVHNAD